MPLTLPLPRSDFLISPAAAAAAARHLQLKPLPIHPPSSLSFNLQKCPSPNSVLSALKSSNLSFTRDFHRAPLDAETDIDERFKVLGGKLEELGLHCSDCIPGQYGHKMCPKCEGGDSKLKGLSLFIREDGRFAMWRCFKAECGWSGSIQDGEMQNVGCRQAKQYRVLSEEDLQLEPLSEEICAYLNDREISAETLRRNAVMQRRCYYDQTFIAFTYRRNGVLVSCKYRGIDKKYWQEPDTEKIFFGLDDIKNASDIIIVEGEMDKLSMEEAGYRNCISVPDGAPGKVSKKLPDIDKDTKFQYLWNCKEYLDKASRIILATDADAPGQALAEELARRLGKERCWRVEWPTKSGTEVFKDANEVLVCSGPNALREVVENAELYLVHTMTD